MIVDGRTVELTHLDRVLYPQAGFTKAQVLDHYARIAPVLLPHLAGRAMTLKRYLHGVQALRRVNAHGDRFAPVLDVVQHLP